MAGVRLGGSSCEEKLPRDDKSYIDFFLSTHACWEWHILTLLMEVKARPEQDNAVSLKKVGLKCCENVLYELLFLPRVLCRIAHMDRLVSLRHLGIPVRTKTNNKTDYKQGL